MAISDTSVDYSSINKSLFGGQTKTEKKEEDPLGRDAFMTMLVAQMKNQDPLNPTEGTDFTAQLATFSSLEQQFNTNDTLESILATLNSRTQDNIIDYIGKDIVSQANTIQLTDGKITGGNYSLDQPADVVVTVYDDKGLEVKTLYEGQQQAGAHSFDWDGVNYYDEKLPDGKYTFDIMALGANGNQLPISTNITGKVTGVDRENDTTFLMVDAGDGSSEPFLVDPDTVVKVWQQPETAAATDQTAEQSVDQTGDQTTQNDITAQTNSEANSNTTNSIF